MPEMSFNALVVSLATSAAVHFGDVRDPSTGQTQAPNLDAAGHMVDLLVGLADKTTGNLTPDEEMFITKVVQELRMRLVEAHKEPSSPTAP